MTTDELLGGLRRTRCANCNATIIGGSPDAVWQHETEAGAAVPCDLEQPAGPVAAPITLTDLIDQQGDTPV